MDAIGLTLRALRCEQREHLPRYARALRAACAAAPPPFTLACYGRLFRQRALDARWLAAGLARNAAVEGEGARKLWRLAGRTPDADVAEQIRQHAVDESRHALVYLAMLVTVFPGAVPADLGPSLVALSPRYRSGDRPPSSLPISTQRLLDEIVQMNIGEIRTRINQLLLGPVIMVVCPRDRRRRLRRMLDSLLRDETRHIGYTAALLEHALAGPHEAFVVRTLHGRLAQFNRRTLDEIGGTRLQPGPRGRLRWQRMPRPLRSAVI